MPASRLDWIVLIRAIAGALGGLPSLFPDRSHLSWLAETVRIGTVGMVPITLTIAGVSLLWLCFTNNWRIQANPDIDLAAAMPPAADG